MKNKKRTLTKKKVIGSIIAALAIIVISIYLMIQKQPTQIQDVYEEIILIVLAIFMGGIIIFAYSKQIK